MTSIQANAIRTLVQSLKVESLKELIAKHATRPGVSYTKDQVTDILKGLAKPSMTVSKGALAHVVAQLYKHDFGTLRQLLVQIQIHQKNAAKRNRTNNAGRRSPNKRARV